MKEIKRKGLTLKIFEEDIESPREYYKDTNIGKMICFHNRYKLGDDHDFEGPRDFNRFVEENRKNIACILPLYLLDHTQLYISTTPFNDIWDSGQIGYIYCTFQDLEKHGLNIEEFDIKSILEDEVQKYAKWLVGCPQYYGFEITDCDDNNIESMGVFELTTEAEMFDAMKERSGHKYDFLFDALLAKQENCL